MPISKLGISASSGVGTSLAAIVHEIVGLRQAAWRAATRTRGALR